DGTPAGTLLADAARFVSASPHATRLRAAAAIIPATKTSSVVLKAPSGVTRTVTLSPSPQQSYTFGMYDRPAGPLTDLGAPDVYYVNLDASGAAPLKDENVAAIKSGMAGKRGVILDLRGYPDMAAWSILAHVAPPDSFGPQMADLSVSPADR